jgi:hypothetical protein
MTSLSEEAKSSQQMIGAQLSPQSRLKSLSRRENWWQKRRLELITLPVGLLLLLSLWSLVIIVGDYPVFILPDPLTVLQ